MKTIKMARTAKKCAKNINKKAIIVAMAAIAGTNYAQEQAAMQAAMQDMQSEGQKVFGLSYTWDPFDGFCA